MECFRNVLPHNGVSARVKLLHVTVVVLRQRFNAIRPLLAALSDMELAMRKERGYIRRRWTQGEAILFQVVERFRHGHFYVRVCLVEVVAVPRIPLLRRSLFNALTNTCPVEDCEYTICKCLEAEIPTTAQGLAHVGKNPGQ